jgi:hypothetical protein
MQQTRLHNPQQCGRLVGPAVQAHRPAARAGDDLQTIDRGGKRMDHDQATAAADAGELTEAVLKPADDANGWAIALVRSDGTQVLFTDSGGTEKVYHDLDQATAAARELGLTQIRVEERF